MREVEKRVRVSRRVFLRGTATAVPAAALAAGGMGISPQAAWAQAAQTIPPAAMATLVRMARDIYPHDHMPDAFYVKGVAAINAKAAKDPALRTLLVQGAEQLDNVAQARFHRPYLAMPEENERVAILQGISDSPFFQKVRSELIVTLYDQHDMWMRFGYEGPSAEKGGYLERGFNDIDWLPQG